MQSHYNAGILIKKKKSFSLTILYKYLHIRLTFFKTTIIQLPMGQLNKRLNIFFKT